MTADHAVIVARATIGLAFAASALAKAGDLRAFRAAIADVEYLPAAWSGPAAAVIVVAEAAVAVAMLGGGNALVPGLAGAAALLVVFSWVIAASLRRRRRLSCNCFGTSARPISAYDLIRNAVLMLCAGGGIWARSASAGDGLPAAEVALAVLVAASLLVVLVNLGDVARTLRRPFWVPP